MTRRSIGLLVVLAFAYLVPFTAEAQPVSKVYRIGYLGVGLSPSPSSPCTTPSSASLTSASCAPNATIS